MNLPTAAHALRTKPGKREAQRILLDLATDSPELTQTLAHLYKYFMPPTPKPKRKTNWQWVAQVVPKKDNRPYLRFVHVTDDRVEATDGHRLHRTPNADHLPAGNYLANGDRVNDPDIFGLWPDTDAIVPLPDRCDPYILDTSAMEIVTVDAYHGYKTPMGAGVRVSYLDQALDGIPRVAALASGPSSAMLLKMGDRIAVIMPLRL